MKKLFIIITLTLIGLGTVAYLIVFNTTQRNIAKEEATLVLKASEIHLPFKNGENLATSYIDQVTRVTGSLTNITRNALELDYMVQVDLIDSLTIALDKGTKVTIKGRCVGYDDLLEVVKIDQAIILPKQ